VRRYTPALLLCFGLALIFAARALWYAADWQHSSLVPLAHNQKVLIVGEVIADPDARDTTLHVNVHVTNISSTTVDGVLLAYFPPDTKLEYGQHIVAKGTLRVPEAFETDSGTFDYKHYLQAQGVSATLTSAQLSTTTPAPFSFAGSLYTIKHAFDASLERIFLAPLGGLIEGILLGERHGIPADLTRAFIIASLVHIVVLSGHVLTLVADAVMRMLGFLPKRVRYPLGAAIIVLFVLMVGASSTALRAGAMALIGLLGRYFNRRTLALRSLAVTAFGMALFNPAIVLWDTSFILSVLAAFGLITFSPLVERWLTWVPERFELRAIATSTVAVEIFILPALLYFTGTLSFLALPANMLALPVLPWAMLGGFLAGALNLIPGVLGPILAFVPAFAAQLLLRWIVFIATTIAHIPYASTTIVAFPLWAMLACYVPLILVASWTMRRSAARQATS
jgi:ComEC/Rec2-related protein